MILKDFEKFRETLNAECENTLLKKGKAYTRGDPDKLKNFKLVAKEFGVSPLLVWGIYWHKHIDAIRYYLKTGQEGPEGIRENFLDARNYLDLGLPLIQDLSTEPEPGMVIYSSE